MGCCCGFRVFGGDFGLEMPWNGRERITGSSMDLGDQLGVIWEVFGALNCSGMERRKIWFLAEEGVDLWVLSGWLLLWECTRERGSGQSKDDASGVWSYWFY